MKKLLIFGVFSLTGCMNMQNPYANLPPSQLTTVSTPQLCKVATSRLYKPSNNVFKEISKRGLRDCSPGELYCTSLGLKYGTHEYVSCRLQYQQYELNKQAAQAAQRQAQEQLRLQRQAMQYQAMPFQQPFNNNVRCATQYSGNMAYTNCN